MRKYFLFLFCILSFSFGCNKAPQLGPPTDDALASASQEDCGYVQNSYGQRVSWKKNLPVRLLIHPNFPAEFEPSLQSAVKQWEDAAGMTLFKIEKAAAGTPESPGYDSQNIIYYLANWDDSQKNLQAVTTLKWAQNILTDADIKVDARFYNFYVSSPKSYGEIHMESLLIHELGHALGLRHKTVSPTVMWATLTGATIREQLSAADIASLKCEY